MRKLGLIGGMGPESTLPYYHDIVYGVNKKTEGKLFPELTIESVNVFKILNCCKEKQYDELVDYLMTAINNLVKCDVDFIALSANTPHIVFDRLQAKCSLPMISIIEGACAETQNRGYKKIGLLGTMFTMKEQFFKTPFVEQKIDIIIPTEEEMDYINEKITSELELGIVKEETRIEFQKIIERMKKENGIEAIVLGCTELPLMLNDEVSPVPCLDTMQIHINTLVNEILKETD